MTGPRIPLKALVCAAATAALVAGGGSGGPVKATLVQLAAHQLRYAGQSVTVSGTVRRQRDPKSTRYYVLSDHHGNLVAIRPQHTAAHHAGQRITVTGTFDINPHFGRLIHIHHLYTPPGR